MESTIQIDVHQPLGEVPTLLLQIGQNKHNVVNIPLARDIGWSERIIPIGYADYIDTFFVGANGVSAIDVSVLWDMVALSDLEEEVIAALRIIAPKVRGVNLVGNDSQNRLV